MNTGVSDLIRVCILGLFTQVASAEISGMLCYPRFTFFKGRAEVILKNARTGEVIAKTISDREDHFSFSEEPKPLYTVVAKTISPNGVVSKFAGEASLGERFGHNLRINMVSKDSAISLVGKVISPEGRPVPECLVCVDPGRYGMPEYADYWSIYITFTDSSGRWRIDRIRPPEKWAVKEFLKHPEWGRQEPLADQSLSARIFVRGGTDYKRYMGLSVWLITEKMCQKLGDIAKHTTVSLPVSTNNVIYLRDIVLPEKKLSGKKD